MTEAEASRILKSRTTDTPDEAWAKIVNSKSQNRFGNNVNPVDMLKNSMLVWGTSRQGQPLPVDIEKTISTYNINDRQKEEILSMAKQINDNAALANASQQGGTESVPSNFPFSKMPGFSAIPQQQQPFYQMSSADIPQPAPQPAPQPLSNPLPEQESLPERQPLTPVAIHTAWSEIQKGTKPEEVQEALLEQGFDLSPESVNMIAIDAVNSGVPANVLQQYLKSIGIEWQPT